MNRETISQIIKEISAGNQEMEELCTYVYECGKDVIDNVPGNQTGWVARKLVHAVGCLAKVKMAPSELLEQGVDYWTTEEGRRASLRIADCVERRRLR